MFTKFRTFSNLLLKGRAPTRLVILLGLISNLLTDIRVTSRHKYYTLILIHRDSLSITHIHMQIPINRSVTPYMR